MELLKLAVFLVAVGVLEAKIIPGKCPTVSTKLDFDATPVSDITLKRYWKLILFK